MPYGWASRLDRLPGRAELHHHFAQKPVGQPWAAGWQPIDPIIGSESLPISLLIITSSQFLAPPAVGAPYLNRFDSVDLLRARSYCP